MTAGHITVMRGLAGIVAVIILWAVFDALPGRGGDVIPGPLEVVLRGVEIMASGAFAENATISFVRIVMGFAIGAGIGVALGLAVGAIPLIRSALLPLVEGLRPIPPLAWVPLAILWFGIGDSSKVFVIAVSALFPAFVGAQRGAEGINPTLVRAARSLDVSGLELAVRVYLPSALPMILMGLRLSWSVAFAVLIAAELIAARSGFGYEVIAESRIGRMDGVFFYIIVLGGLSVATDALWRWIIARLERRGFTATASD
jgi:ABC-type nitrate/sulfonate/bicarbonate transport system permease component